MCEVLVTSLNNSWLAGPSIDKRERSQKVLAACYSLLHVKKRINSYFSPASGRHRKKSIGILKRLDFKEFEFAKSAS